MNDRPQTADRRPPIDVYNSRITHHALRITLLSILLLAFALRMVRIADWRMWGDEAYSVFSAQRTFAAITLEGAENDPHPPLYYYLLHLYMPLAGTSELALRFFSVFPGVATVALLYIIGKRLFGPRVGLMASALAAIAPFDVYYSQEIRMYALAIFLTTLALYWFIRWWLQDARPPTADGSPRSAVRGRWSAVSRPWFPYALAMFFALYSLYHAGLVLLAEGVFLLPFFKTRRSFVTKWFTVAGGIVLLFLPWLLFRFSSTLGHLEDRAGHNILALPTFLWRGFAALTVGATLDLTTALTLALIFLTLILIAVVIALRLRQANWTDGLVVTQAFVPIIAVYPIYLLLPIFVARVFALAFAPLALVLARSLAVLAQRSRLAAVVFALSIAGVSAYSLSDYYFRFDRYNAAAEDYMPVVRAVEQSAQAGDVVLFHATWHMGYFLGHYRGPELRYLLLDHPEDLRAAVTQPRNIWAVVQGFDFHGSEVWLSRNAFPVSEQRFGQIRLVQFRAGIPTRGERFGTPVVYNNGAALLGYRVNGEPLESGRGLLTVELDWQAASKIAEDYTVSVRLRNASGERVRADAVWAQVDNRPASGTRDMTTWQPDEIVEDRHALVVPSGTPPGTYTVQVVMYSSASGAAANIIAPDNMRAQSVSLGIVNVVKPKTPSVVSALPNRLNARWNEIALEGFAGPEQVAAGDFLPLTLLWRAREQPRADYVTAMQLVDAAGKTHPAVAYRPANEVFPTRQWEPGETWLDKISLRVDADTAPGDATLWIGLADDSSRSPVPLATDVRTRDVTLTDPPPLRMNVQAIELYHVRVSARDHAFDPPSPQNPLQVNLNNQVELLGYDLTNTTLKPSESLQLTLYWRSLDSMSERYAVFVHLLDGAGDLVAQQDNEPAAGAAPTTSWLRGEVVADSYQLTLPGSLPAGEYRLIVGMYQAATGQRLPVVKLGFDSVPLTTIRITPP